MRKVSLALLALAAAYAAAANLPITTKVLDDVLIASIRYQGSYADMGKYHEELRAAVGALQAGPAFDLLYDMGPGDVHDVEVCMPVKEAVNTGNVKTRTLAGGTFARTLHLGAYDNLGETWMQLVEFVSVRNIGAEGAGRQIYLMWDQKNDGNNITELMVPVSKAVEEGVPAGPSMRVMHFEIPADDPARAVAFYGKVFGWKIEAYGGQPYWLCSTGTGLGIDGAIYPRAPGDVTRDTVAVPDVEATMKAIEAAGGKVTTPKMAVMGVGWLIYFKDTEGNVLGAIQPDANAK